MIDQLFDRNYQDARAHMNRDIAKGLRLIRGDILNAFEALRRVQFAAPWKAPRKKSLN